MWQVIERPSDEIVQPIIAATDDHGDLARCRVRTRTHHSLHRSQSSVISLGQLAGDLDCVMCAPGGAWTVTFSRSPAAPRPG